MSLGLNEGETYTFLRREEYMLVKDRVTNDNPTTFNEDLQSVISIFLASLFYGGIHLIAWNRAFRTTAEAVLWKLSGIGIIAIGVTYPVVSHFVDHRRNSPLGKILSLILAVVFVLEIFFYIFCRTYIIVECFLDLIHLPDSAFQVSSWSQYFPHI